MVEQFENNYETTLVGGINTSVTTITVATAPATMTGNFRIVIEDEIILVGAVAGLTFTGCVRGEDGTTAASHADATPVYHVVTLESFQGALDEAANRHGSKAIEATIDGGGAVIQTGVRGFVEVPFACTLTAVRMFADVSGSITVDIWKDTYANYPPVDADSITASNPPAITSGTKSQDTTLTGWTTALAVGDVLAFNVDSATNIKLLVISLRVTRT